MWSQFSAGLMRFCHWSCTSTTRLGTICTWSPIYYNIWWQVFSEKSDVISLCERERRVQLSRQDRKSQSSQRGLFHGLGVTQWKGDTVPLAVITPSPTVPPSLSLPLSPPPSSSPLFRSPSHSSCICCASLRLTPTFPRSGTGTVGELAAMSSVRESPLWVNGRLEPHVG